MKRTVTIAGGGIAGLSLGIALRQRGVPVVLHEAGTYPRHRVCGEFIAGQGTPILTRLGLDHLVTESRKLTGTLWRSGAGGEFRATLPSPALGISRYRLDAALADRFRTLGGCLHTASRYTAEDAPGTVWACGRRHSQASQWIGLKCHAVGFPQDTDLELHLGHHAYAGCSPVEGGTVNICGLFRLDASIHAPRSRLLIEYLTSAGLASLADRLSAATVDEPSCCGVSGLEFDCSDGDTHRARIGDSGQMIAPFTGNGMSLAMEDAVAAAPHIERWASGALDWQDILRMLHRAQVPLRRRIRRARFLHPLLLDPHLQKLVLPVAKAGLLPFRPVFHLLH